jgi:hypothetical protein
MSNDRIKALLTRYLGGQSPIPKPVDVTQRAKDLIDAIDAGGLPLNPFIVNDIGRQLGLDVATDAPMMDTIARIRKTLGST